MKRSTANKKKQKVAEASDSNEEVEKEELIEQFVLREMQEIDESEDLDLMSPADFIATINDSYVLRKQTGRSRLKFHPKKVTIKNYW
jgi:hypothetical protein